MVDIFPAWCLGPAIWLVLAAPATACPAIPSPDLFALEVFAVGDNSYSNSPTVFCASPRRSSNFRVFTKPATNNSSLAFNFGSGIEPSSKTASNRTLDCLVRATLAEHTAAHGSHTRRPLPSRPTPIAQRNDKNDQKREGAQAPSEPSVAPGQEEISSFRGRLSDGSAARRSP